MKANDFPVAFFAFVFVCAFVIICAYIGVW